MKTHVFNEQKDLVIEKNAVANIVTAFLDKENIFCDEVNIHFVDKTEISYLHEKYFADPTPTDCISFPIDSPGDSNTEYSVLGDVFVCCQIAIEYAQTHNANPYDEATLYLVHGLLHLIGYDDIQEKDKKIMKNKEKSCMQFLKEKQLGLHKTHKILGENN